MSRVSDEICEEEGYDVEKVENNLVYVKGFKYPLKGVPTIERIEKANEIKRAIKGFRSLKNIVLPDAELSEFSNEIYYIVLYLTHNFHTANCISFVLEYDQGYSLRFQDLFNETTKEKLKSPLEILKLSKIHKERDIGGFVHKKLKYMFWLLALYAILPKWGKAIEQADFSKLQMDDGDRYWARMKQDYNYFGQTYNERNGL